MSDASPPPRPDSSGPSPRPDSPSNSGADARALSDVLSYALVFSLIVISIAVVTVGGLASLQDARTAEQLQNADRAYDVLHDNLADVHSEGAPGRTTEISLGDASLYLGDYVTMRVKVQGVSPAMEVDAIRPLVFRIDDRRSLVYEAGATIQDTEDGGLMLNEPPFVFGDDGTPDSGQVHVPVVNTSAATVQSVGGTTILVRGQSTEREVLYSAVDGGANVEWIELETPRYDIWADYFEAQGYCDSLNENPPATPSDHGTVVCHLDGDHNDPRQFYVTHQEIAIELVQ